MCPQQRKHPLTPDPKGHHMTTLTTRGIWLGWTFLLSLITGLTGGALTYLGGDNPANATIAGAVTFGSTIGLALLVISFLTPSGPSTPQDHNQ